MLQLNKSQQQHHHQKQTPFYSTIPNHAQRKYLSTKSVIQLVVTIITCLMRVNQVNAGVFFPRGGSFGYLAAVAIPLDLPNRNVYMAFNFESNYGLPSNDSYNEWIDRWNLSTNYLSIGNNVTRINGRNMAEKEEERRKRSLPPPFDRRSFYRTFTGYLDLYQMNGTGCLLRTICEVAASSMEENNGVLGSILKVIFMPTTSRPETPLHADLNDQELYRAEWRGRQHLAAATLENTVQHRDGDGEDDDDDEADSHDGGGDGDGNEGHVDACLDYSPWCPEGVINMISTWY